MAGAPTFCTGWWVWDSNISNYTWHGNCPDKPGMIDRGTHWEYVPPPTSPPGGGGAGTPPGSSGSGGSAVPIGSGGMQAPGGGGQTAGGGGPLNPTPPSQGEIIPPASQPSPFSSQATLGTIDRSTVARARTHTQPQQAECRCQLIVWGPGQDGDMGVDPVTPQAQVPAQYTSIILPGPEVRRQGRLMFLPPESGIMGPDENWQIDALDSHGHVTQAILFHRHPAPPDDKDVTSWRPQLFGNDSPCELYLRFVFFATQAAIPGETYAIRVRRPFDGSGIECRVRVSIGVPDEAPAEDPTLPPPFELPPPEDPAVYYGEPSYGQSVFLDQVVPPGGGDVDRVPLGGVTTGGKPKPPKKPVIKILDGGMTGHDRPAGGIIWGQKPCGCDLQMDVATSGPTYDAFGEGFSASDKAVVDALRIRLDWYRGRKLWARPVGSEISTPGESRERPQLGLWEIRHLPQGTGDPLGELVGYAVAFCFVWAYDSSCSFLSYHQGVENQFTTESCMQSGGRLEGASVEQRALKNASWETDNYEKRKAGEDKKYISNAHVSGDGSRWFMARADSVGKENPKLKGEELCYYLRGLAEVEEEQEDCVEYMNELAESGHEANPDFLYDYAWRTVRAWLKFEEGANGELTATGGVEPYRQGGYEASSRTDDGHASRTERLLQFAQRIEDSL